MLTVSKKSLHAAVLAALSAAGTAQAVHINPDGLGQVLIYPYYTVRSGNVTAMSIINTTSLTKAVKVRFLEGKNSREVMDFNLFLAPTDVWTGVVLPTLDGARLETGDNSCVTPSDFFANAAGVVRNDALGLPLNAFKNYQYTRMNTDNPTLNTLDRTREGYIEVIEMGIVTDATLQGYIKHNGAGAPANCAALDAYDSLSQIVTPVVRFPGNYLASPGGGLTGRASIINSASGTNYTYDVTALDGWWEPPAPGPGSVPYTASGVATLSISTQAGISTVSYVPVTGNPAIPNSTGVVRAVWASSREAVSAVFMRDSIINEFVTDAGTLSKTDWVITMPTKRDNIGVGSGGANRPFTNSFGDTATTAFGSCDIYTLGIFNREEGTLSPPLPVLIGVRPPSVPNQGQSLCWSANVLEFGTTGLLRSINNFRLQGAADAFATTGATTTGAALATFSRRTPQGPNGWAALGFGVNTTTTQVRQSMTPLSATLNGVAITGTHFGLPVIGAMFHNYTNSGVNSSYGGVIPHKFTRNISIAVPVATN